MFLGRNGFPDGFPCPHLLCVGVNWPLAAREREMQVMAAGDVARSGYQLHLLQCEVNPEPVVVGVGRAPLWIGSYLKSQD